jgi:pimeloyl-ACP methyl ester carboxylesterase
MVNLAEYCASNATFRDEMIAVSDSVSLRVFTFTPAVDRGNPEVILVAGWISQISGWKDVLQEMTKDFKIYYLETREKISSKVTGKIQYGVEDIGSDIVNLISYLKLKRGTYILLASSLGATAVLDSCRFLREDPFCLILIGPNAVFRVPGLGMFIIRIFPPALYAIIKPVVKWYLRNFRLDLKSDYAQYVKYCNALDAADPWKLKKAVIALSTYEVWPLLGSIDYPTLIIGASKDRLHEPQNLQRMVSVMKNASYIDLETNKITHSDRMVEEIRRYVSQIKADFPGEKRD